MSKSQTTAQQNLASFGVFVGLFNKLNNTSFSVTEALSNSELTGLFAVTAQTLQSEYITTSVKSQAKSSKSTKRLSYDEFQVKNGTSIAHSIYKYCKQVNKPLSRNDIAQGLNIRLSTTCGQVHALVKAGLLTVEGSKIDQASEMKVETLVYR